MFVPKWFKFWLQAFKQKKEKKKYSFTLDDLSNLELIESKNQEKTPGIYVESLPEDFYSTESYQGWIKLSRRERDVTALTCLAYTNYQIAARLGLSIETVRTYLKSVLGKLRLRNKADLRVYFAKWNFSDWERRKDPHR